MDGHGQPQNDSLPDLAGPPAPDIPPDTVAAWPYRPRPPKLRHIGHGNLTVEGVSGTVYRFYGHGAVLKVNADDAAALLQTVQDHRGCCGNAQVWREQLLVEVRD